MFHYVCYYVWCTIAQLLSFCICLQVKFQKTTSLSSMCAHTWQNQHDSDSIKERIRLLLLPLCSLVKSSRCNNSAKNNNVETVLEGTVPPLQGTGMTGRKRHLNEAGRSAQPADPITAIAACLGLLSCAPGVYVKMGEEAARPLSGDHARRRSSTRRSLKAAQFQMKIKPTSVNSPDVTCV